MEEYRALAELRKIIGLAQKDAARRLAKTQENVPTLEDRSNMELSTLKRYVEALGDTLELYISMPQDENKNCAQLNI